MTQSPSIGSQYAIVPPFKLSLRRLIPLLCPAWTQSSFPPPKKKSSEPPSQATNNYKFLDFHFRGILETFLSLLYRLVPRVTTNAAKISRVWMEERVGKTVRRLENDSSVIVLSNILASCVKVVWMHLFIVLEIF